MDNTDIVKILISTESLLSAFPLMLSKQNVSQKSGRKSERTLHFRKHSLFENQKPTSGERMVFDA
jgi:hypothetical protein